MHFKSMKMRLKEVVILPNVTPLRSDRAGNQTQDYKALLIPLCHLIAETDD